MGLLTACLVGLSLLVAFRRVGPGEPRHGKRGAHRSPWALSLLALFLLLLGSLGREVPGTWSHFLGTYDSTLTIQTASSFPSPTAAPTPIPVAATVDLKPESLGKKSKGQSVTVFIELPSGHDVAKIDVSSLRLCLGESLCGGSGVPADGKPKVGDADDDGVPDLKVTFDRADVIALVADVPAPATVTFAVTGVVAQPDRTFVGTDTVRLVDPDPAPAATGTPTAVPTATPAETPTPTATPANATMQTSIPTGTPTPAGIPTATTAATPTIAAVDTPAPTAAPTGTPTPTSPPTGTPTAGPASPTATPAATPAATATPPPATATPTETVPPTATATPVPSATPTWTPSPTATATPSPPTPTATGTATVAPAAVPPSPAATPAPSPAGGA